MGDLLIYKCYSIGFVQLRRESSFALGAKNGVGRRDLKSQELTKVMNDE